MPDSRGRNDFQGAGDRIVDGSELLIRAAEPKQILR